MNVRLRPLPVTLMLPVPTHPDLSNAHVTLAGWVMVLRVPTSTSVLPQLRVLSMLIVPTLPAALRVLVRPDLLVTARPVPISTNVMASPAIPLLLVPTLSVASLALVILVGPELVSLVLI